MYRTKWKIILFCALLGLAITNIVPGQPLPAEFMSVEEIQPGMKGYGKTVFKADQVEQFDAEILGIFKNAFPQQDIIIARLSGGPLKEMGVIAGMSGSPVFIDDRLIGAVAYGWGFAKEPIAGITPVADMLKIMQLTEEKATEETASSTALFPISDFSTYGRQLQKIDRVKLGQSLTTNEYELSQEITLEPLATPLFVSGCHPQVMQLVKKFFSPYYLMPVLGGTRTKSVENPDITIEPGSALGVQLLTGDMDFSGIGTVTYVKDDKLIAFGHPMFLNGNVNVPMTTALIHSVMPSIYRPFKLGEVVEAVGSVRQDRLPAIGGVFGKIPFMVPIKISIDLPDMATKRNFQYFAWEDKEFTPMLADISLIESIMASYKFFGDSAAKLTYQILLNNGLILEKKDFFSTQFSIAFPLSMNLYLDLMQLMSNPYTKVRVEEVKVAMELIDKVMAIDIIGARIDKNVYKPGEKVQLTIFYQPFYSEEIKTFETTLQLPAQLEEGTYTIMIGDGEYRKNLEFSRAPGIRQVTNFDQLVKLMSIHYPQNYVYIALQQMAPGLTIKGKELPALPDSVQTEILSATTSGFTGQSQFVLLAEEKIETNYQVSGAKLLSIKVKKRIVK